MADEPMDFTQGNTIRGLSTPRANRKLTVITLCTDRQFTTLGSTTYKYFIVGPRALLGIGPSIEDITCQARGKDFSANFNWKLVGDKSVDSELWEQFATLLIPVQTSAGQIVAAVHSARADYANNIRFCVGAANGSGTANELGTLTAYAAIKFWS